MTEITRILHQIEQGDPHAAQKLLPLVYNELRIIAGAKLALERPGQTLQATALVHEVYLRLVDERNVQQWSCRGYFFAAAAEAMRRILIDQARRKRSEKHGGAVRRVPFDELAPISSEERASLDELLSLDEALTQFESVHPEKARLVKLRYFAGLSLEDTARAMDISVATAKRHWVFARSWLFGKLQGQ